MTTESFKRRLTAILSADVEGYSRLMCEDEEGTIRTLKAYRERQWPTSSSSTMARSWTLLEDAGRCYCNGQAVWNQSHAGWRSSERGDLGYRSPDKLCH